MSTLTNAMLDELYQKLLAENATQQAHAYEHGFFTTNLTGRMPRTKNRRIRNKWLRSGRSLTFKWVAPYTYSPDPNKPQFFL